MGICNRITALAVGACSTQHAMAACPQPEGLQHNGIIPQAASKFALKRCDREIETCLSESAGGISQALTAAYSYCSLDTALYMCSMQQGPVPTYQVQFRNGLCKNSCVQACRQRAQMHDLSLFNLVHVPKCRSAAFHEPTFQTLWCLVPEATDTALCDAGTDGHDSAKLSPAGNQ